MSMAEMSSNFQQIWDKQPGMVLLLGLAFVLFLFIVVDTWRFKHSHRRPNKGLWKHV
jgi:hypothetical protein